MNKKHLLLSLALCLMMPLGAWAQLAGGTYYLYNVGADRYLNYGGSDNYTACLKPHGEPVVLAASGSGFTIQTALDSRYLSATATSENARQSTGTVFTFTQQADGTYTIESSAGFMGYDGTTASNLAGTLVKMSLSDGTSDNTHWQVLSKADLEARLSAASPSNPVDATFFITCPNFDRHHSGLSAWSNLVTNNANVGTGANTGYLCNNSAWVFNTSNACYQTLTVPNGTYLLKVQSFYRNSSNSNAVKQTETTMPLKGVVYANGDEATVLPILSTANLQTQTFYTDNGGQGTAFGSGYIPYFVNSSSQYKYSTDACIAFDHGLFSGNEVETTVTDGSLTIGAKFTELVTNSWMAFDNFELYYLGMPVDLTPFKEAYYALRTKIQNNIVGQTAVFTDNDGALASYNAVLATQDDIVENATSEEEITAAKTALWNAALTFMKSVEINDGMGFDLTWMIGDPDFSDQNYKNYWTEECNSTNAHGYTSGVLRYYNSPFNVYQQLPYILPAGAYRMTVDGFERTNDPRDTAWADFQAGNSVVTGAIYLNNNEQLVMNLFDYRTKTDGGWGGKQPSGASFYIPDGSGAANTYLQNGAYPNTLIGVLADDALVTIGYRCANTKAWTAVDNFKLWYIGEVPQVAISNEAGVLTPVCAPFTLSTDDDSVEELYALAGEESEGSLSIYPVNTVTAGTPCYAKFSIDNYSAPMEMTLTNGKKFVMPWDGGWARVNAANDTWTYYGMDGDSHPDAEIGKVVLDFNDMEFDVNLENLAARRYLNLVSYSGSSEASEVAAYNVAPPTRRDIPNAVMIPLPAHNDEIEITIQNSNLEEVVRIMVPAGATEAYVYNLLPQETYYFEASTGYRGQFHTKGHLRMVYAPSAYNIRDLGGWETQDGYRTTYGHLFRGSTLNGYVNCTPEDIQALKDLGIGGEIDLRYQESYDKDMGCGTSAFGFGADDYYFAAANDYTAANLNESGTQQRLKQEFDFILNHFRQGKAVYFHCAWGADRTGMLSFLLEGLLGLTIDQIYKDYELTSFSVAGNRLKTSFQDRIDVILALDGATLRDKFENYFLNKLGVSMDDITYFRSVMLEVYPLTIDEDANVPAYYNGKADITLHRTLKAGMHNTVVLPCDLDLWKAKDFFGRGTKIENIVSYEDGVLKTEEITKDTDIAPANKPFLLVPTVIKDGNIYTLDDVPICEGELTAAEFTNGKMVGTYTAIEVAKSTETGKENYVISNDQFYVIGSSAAPMKSTRAYLVLDTPASGVKSIVTFDSEATGIDQVPSTKDGVPSTIYDLSGRRVGQPTRGLYIVNGKKVYVK